MLKKLSALAQLQSKYLQTCPPDKQEIQTSSSSMGEKCLHMKSRKMGSTVLLCCAMGASSEIEYKKELQEKHQSCLFF